MNNNLSLDPMQPVGIFDSGVGGLTVARALVDKLPQENLIYFGDTAHFPYGEKSVTALKDYAINIADILLKKGAKVILIACNTASSVTFEILKNYVGKRALVLDVINPMVDLVSQNYAGKKIGLIGSKQTVNSGVYQNKIAELNKNIEVSAVATPLLIAAIEEGFADHHIIDELLKVYLNNPNFKDIKALVLGCTHYPLIKNKISEFYQGKVQILDSSTIVAEYVAKFLADKDLLNDGKKLTEHFYVSDYTDAFAEACQRFFAGPVELEMYSY